MECAICLTAPHNPEMVQCCQKIFCSACLLSWVQVKNSCPLCIAPIGTQPVNNLSSSMNQQFDNGSLVLENEIASIVEKMNTLNLIFKGKKETAYNHKSHFPKAHLNFVNQEMAFAEENLEIASLAISEGDRVTATNTIQALTESLLNIEAILMGESTIEEDWGYSSEEQDDYDYDMEEEIYIKASRQKARNTASKNGGSKKKLKIEN